MAARGDREGPIPRAADPIDPVALLDRLTEVEAFERFLQRTFPGKTRFSIEGLDTLVPMLDEVIAEAAEAGLRQAFIGMAHRGRLNVMAHVLGKPYEQILAEFKDPVGLRTIRRRQWSGDVKYHLGASRADPRRRDGRSRRVDAAESQPSRGDRSRRRGHGPRGRDRRRAARFAALRSRRRLARPRPRRCRLSGAGHRRRDAEPDTGSTATTRAARSTSSRTIRSASRPIPIDSYSTLYASGLARGFKIPIVHVNADDPEAVHCGRAPRVRVPSGVQARRLVDLVGYRRLRPQRGRRARVHPAGDVRPIGAQPTVRQQWAAHARVARSSSTPAARAAMLRASGSTAPSRLDALDPEADLVEATPVVAAPGTAAQARDGRVDRAAARVERPICSRCRTGSP